MQDVGRNHGIARVTRDLKNFGILSQQHWSAVVVQDEHTDWIQGYPMKSNETSETMASLWRFLSPSQKRGIIFSFNSKKLLETWQELQWNHDTSAFHRTETNGVAEGGTRRVEEGTAVVLGPKWTTQFMVGLCIGVSLFPGGLHSRNVLEKRLMDQFFFLHHRMSISRSQPIKGMLLT